MKVFKDKTGREWELALTIATAMDVKDKLGVDLLQPEAGEPPLITRIGTDEMLLAEIILCLIVEQIEARGVSERDIRKAFDGVTILAAQRAFYEELVDFFRSRGREDRARAVEKQTLLIDQGIRMMQARIERIDTEMVLVNAMMGGIPTPGRASGNSPASPGSIPAR